MKQKRHVTEAGNRKHSGNTHMEPEPRRYWNLATRHSTRRKDNRNPKGVVQAQDGWGVTYTATDICAMKGSTVNIRCTYTHPSNVRAQETFWHIKWTNTGPEDLRTQSEYSDRVQYQCEDKTCTLTIRDLRETDSAQYKFRFITNQQSRQYTGSPGVTLTVTALQVQVTRVTVLQSYTEAELKCLSSDSPAGGLTYVWFQNGQKVPDVESASYKGRFGPGDDISCALKEHEACPSPPVYAPKLLSVSMSPSAEIVEGSSVTLTCSSDANPAANYTWYKENEASPKASGQNFTITDIRPEDSGKYYCEAQNTRGRHNTTSHLTVGAAVWRSAAAGTIPAVLLVITLLTVFLWIRRNKFKHREEPDNNTQQLQMVPVYDAPSSSAQRQEAQQQDELDYSTICFSENQADVLYSNICPAPPHRQAEEEEDDEKDGVEYTTVKFGSCAQGTRCEEHREDSFSLYSTVHKKYKTTT